MQVPDEYINGTECYKIAEPNRRIFCGMMKALDQVPRIVAWGICVITHRRQCIHILYCN